MDAVRASAPRVAVDRLRPGDVLELATDVGPAPSNVGALLLLSGDVPADAVQDALVDRLGRVRRLADRVVSPPRPLGRPYWARDPGFDVRDHLSQLRCVRTDDDALLAVATDAVTSPLPRHRPLWRVSVLVGPAGTAVGVVVVLHHVITDGVGGLVLLARLADGVDVAARHDTAGSRRGPTTGALARDVLARALAGLRGAPASARLLARGAVELGVSGHGAVLAPRTSVNAPTGPCRRVTVVDVDLVGVRQASRRHDATVNDVLLVAVAGALGRLLAGRGEHPPELVVSVPVSGRPSGRDDLGNDVGVMPVRVPVHGTRAERLACVSRRTRAQKAAGRGSSSALVGPAFRLLARLGLFPALIDRQRLVNTFLSDVRGPSQPLLLSGAPVVRTIPLVVSAGNVAVAFAALSYAGRLTVSVVVDPELVPDLEVLRAGLEDELRDVLRDVLPRGGAQDGVLHEPGA
ncbi:wax ester/triacylglycerol synthase domain-containing protein [uncultured Cellulomonas sp.]|uniref:wax ester/triacylglycerol synthase domain-containing protein n=1 Tax=uncultured Cellulomonas sp. TaxID=189682 RepID=UPI002639B444|nr:wax ester/triacylglycerol synthase domain-containing protein [uncultured Cellulomonas sp.]